MIIGVITSINQDFNKKIRCSLIRIFLFFYSGRSCQQITNGIFYGSRRVLATTVPTFGSDVFSNIHNNQDAATNPYKLNNNNYYLNYLNTYNWTNDLPANTNAKVTFVSILSNFISYNDECQLLEVGAFAGTSVVGM